MANRIATLAEIKRAMEAEEVETFASVKVFVVNHFAEVNFPRKYVYTACPRRVAGFGRNGRTGGNSLEGKRCKEHPHQEMGVDVFRFDLFVSDATEGGRPLQVTMFDAVGALLKKTADVFRNLTEQAQTQLVLQKILQMPECYITLRVHDGYCYVHNLVVIGDGGDPPTTYMTPQRGLSFAREAYGTPTLERGALSFAAGSSTLANRNEALKEKVSELVDLIADSLTLKGKDGLP